MKFITALLLFQLSFAASAIERNYATDPEVLAFIKEVATRENIPEKTLVELFKRVEYREDVIQKISKPVEKTFNWGQYRALFLDEPRVAMGADFIHKNFAVFQDISKTTGVPVSIIAAIIGIETKFGTIMGNHRVMDALTTLAFDYPRRSKFFRSELAHFIHIAYNHNKNPLNFVGSYAGAMGYGQFMPSSYRNFAINYDSNTFIDLWTSEHDSIASVANYLKEHRWQGNANAFIAKKLPSKIKVDATLVDTELLPKHTYKQLRTKIKGLPKVPKNIQNQLTAVMQLTIDDREEYWLAFHNFYVITRYNHSHLYAMAVYTLANAIEKSYTETYKNTKGQK